MKIKNGERHIIKLLGLSPSSLEISNPYSEWQIVKVEKNGELEAVRERKNIGLCVERGVLAPRASLGREWGGRGLTISPQMRY